MRSNFGSLSAPAFVTWQDSRRRAVMTDLQTLRVLRVSHCFHPSGFTVNYLRIIEARWYGTLANFSIANTQHCFLMHILN